jgi:hypothetical protein
VLDVLGQHQLHSSVWAFAHLISLFGWHELDLSFLRENAAV